jgi:hypothetical protein
VVGVLHGRFIQGSEHLVEVAGPRDALVESSIVGFVGAPALLENEGARVLVVLDELERTRTHRRPAPGCGLRRAHPASPARRDGG